MKKKHFECDRKTCFGNVCGFCDVLETPSNKTRCPFYKTVEQVEYERAMARGRLKRRYRYK